MPTRWLNLDPSRTYSLRMRYVRDIRRRLRWLDKELWNLIVTLDAFGLEETQPFQLVSYHNAIRHQYKFLTNPQKVKQFRAWLDQQVNAGVLGVDVPSSKNAWTSTYVDSAYRKGMMRSYTDVHKADLAVSPAWYGGSKEQFLKSAFLQPEMLSKIEMLYERAFENMKGLTDTMKGQLGRILADGVAHGQGARKVAREMRKSIKTLSRGRASTIARTEMIYAHAEGQLDSFELLGVEEVSAKVEWSTAGDDRVCPECASYEGVVYKVKDARGLIPLHPNCRCAWMPAEDTSKTKSKRTQSVTKKVSKPKKPTRKGIPKFLQPTPSLTMGDAIRVADDVGSSIIGVDVKVAIKAQEDGFRFVFGKPMSESVRAGWLKTYRQRKEFMGVKYKKSGHAFQSINEERLLRLQNANNDNAVNSTYRSVLEKNSAGRQHIILRRPPEVSYAAEQIGGTTHYLDSPFMDGLKDVVPLPGGVNCTSTCGLQGALRHEYGHSLWFKSETASKKKFLDILRAHTGDEIERGITQYAGANTYRGEEAFCELFSMRTSRVWDASKFPEWVQDLTKTIESDFM